MSKWFSYDATNGFEQHDTETEAKAACEATLDFLRTEAHDNDGWDEDAATSVCWGEIRGRARWVPDDPVDEDPEYNGGNYELAEVKDV